MLENLIEQFLVSLNKSNEGIFMIDIDREGFPYKYVNNSFSQITGYSIHEIIGQNFLFSSIHLNENVLINQIYDCIKKCESNTYELKGCRKDISTYWCRFSLTPIYNNNRARYFLGILRDITDYRKLVIQKYENIAMKTTLETVNDIINNYLDYIETFRMDLEEKYKIEPSLFKSFDDQFFNVITKLRKVNLLEEFKTKRLNSNMTVLDVGGTEKNIKDVLD